MADILDPNCVALPGFPGVPQESYGCAPPYLGDYTSRAYSIRDSAVPKHVPLAPIFRVQTGSEDIEQLRVRLEYSPNKTYVAYINYQPANTYLVIDSRVKRSDIRVADGTWSNAGHLVSAGTGGQAFHYQQLVCPSQMVMWVDLPVAYNADLISVSFAFAARDA